MIVANCGPVELVTRPTGYDQALKVQGPAKDGHPPASQSTLRNLTNTSAALTQERDLEIQKLRITQMKNLRREIKKLEKLETLRLAAGGHPDGQLSQLVRFGHYKFTKMRSLCGRL